MTEYVIVNKDEVELFKNNNPLTKDEGEQILLNEDLFTKFLDKTKFSYQIELCKGTYRGKEERLYVAMEVIEEIKQSLKHIRKEFIRMRDEKKDKD